MSPQSKYWGDVSPLSHMDRRPWTVHIVVHTTQLRALPTGSKCDQVSTHTLGDVRIEEEEEYQFILFITKSVKKIRQLRCQFSCYVLV